jgi:hypothetical protein
LQAGHGPRRERQPRASQTGEWAEGHRYLGLDLLARCRITVINTDDEIGDDNLPPALTA